MTAGASDVRAHDHDWIVVGSGFGGAVCALRLAEKGHRVAVLEQGRRFADADFPRSAWDVRRFLWAPALGLRGIMRVKAFRHVSVLSGVGVGGGSLVYANTLYEPRSDAFYRHPQWAGLADWRAALAPHYRTARRMLGVVPFTGDGGPSEAVMRGVARDLGVEAGLRATDVGIYFGAPGERAADPYFGGAGPERTGCIRCGRCLLGCRVGAKNTLVKNYLWLAERLGAVVLPERRVVDVRPLGAPDGADGYAVTTERPGAWLRRRRTVHTARGVVLAGGALGTNELLRACRDSGSLPGLSDRLGELVRTNSEAITAATSLDPRADYTSDIAITASLYPDADTHVTNNTYGGAGDALALTYGPLTAGHGPRRAGALLATIARHPLRTLRRADPRGWSRRTVIFTVMQSTETAIRLRATRRGGLQTEPDAARPLTAYLPIANRVAELAAARMGGYAQSALGESLAGTPTTAHFLGGAVIGASPQEGVVDRYRRAFGYRDLLVCDGASVPANVGVNPSLTITAMAEEAMAHVPPAAQSPTAEPSQEPAAVR